jgi:hypothetical protein
MEVIKQVRKFAQSTARMVSLVLLACFSFIYLGGLLPLEPASAQSSARASLTPPDIKGFPTLTAYLDVLDDQGQFVHQLLPGEVTLLEDDQPVKVQEIREVEPGIRVMVAINAGLPLAVRDQQGVARYDTIAKALQAWVKAQQAASQNDYSLLANPGPLATFVTNPADWLTAFNAYQPDMRSVQPNLDSLDQAITLSGDSMPRSGMERAILYITPPPEDSQLSAFGDLTARATQTGVHIFVWMAGAPSDFSTKGAAALTQLAGDTGGQFFAFSGVEQLPDIQAYLDPLRYIYSLTYLSTANKSGTYTLSAQIKHAGLNLTTTKQSFTISIQPPNPMFVSPPEQIVRQSPPGSQDPLAALAPTRQTLQVLIEFPDGHPRDLKYTRLYVDGKLVVENITPPFDKFTWDLSGYTKTARHVLTMEVQDILGLTTMSSQVPVQVTVTIPQTGILKNVSQNRNLVPLAAIGVAGTALAIVLLAGWRRRARGEAGAKREKARDPVTQPIPIRDEAGRFPPAAWTEKLVRPRRAEANEPVVARLVRLAEDIHETLAESSISIGAGEVTFGRDPTQATCVIDAPSVEALHARLRQAEDGSFILCDMGSVAGTWVNYAPISSDGIHLEHGDLVHIGKVGFRFELGKPVHVRRPQIRLLK